MKGKCNCGKAATCEFLVTHPRDKTVTTMKFCQTCRPKYNNPYMQHIYGIK